MTVSPSIAAKAARVHRFGDPSVIVVEDIELRAPAAGEIRLRVGAAGVGPWDAWVRAGKSVLPQALPLTLGADVAGEIEALGEDVSGFAVGQSVFGATNARFVGGYATSAIAEAGRLVLRPPGVSDVAAAASPVVAVTAWQALFEEAKLERGETVLIHGAAGGVGAFAVQLARAAGIEVVATADARDIPFVESLGASQAIDFRRDRFESHVKSVDAVIDLVGGDAQIRSLAVLKPGGRLISTVAPPDPAAAERAGVEARFFLVDVTTARLQRIGPMFEAGTLRADVGATLKLEEAIVAHEMLEGRLPKPRGKIVLVP